ncbi:IS66 family transposase [Escherichia coli]|uniref:IS66 family transposase n=1 Tax=Escherichia coli TaxID=562 RepID=UPI00235E4D98|nr:transposase [Escherichia coli]
MNDTSSDDILLLKQRLAEQEALIHALQEKLSNREREIDHLQAQLDKLRRMNFGSRSEKVSRRIAQMEADLNLLQQESDTLTGRVDDPAVQRPLRQTRTRKPFPESLPRDEKRLLPTEPCCPPDGPLNKAINYILNRRDELSCFLSDGAVPLDNNICERAIRPVVMGRKAWLFAGSLMAGNRAAQIMSLLETAKRNGLEPHAWLTDVLTRLPEWPEDRLAELLPLEGFTFSG